LSGRRTSAARRETFTHNFVAGAFTFTNDIVREVDRRQAAEQYTTDSLRPK
jgi:hypothetical protein